MGETGKRKGEPQYEPVIREMKRRGPERLGLMTSWAWHDDPKRLGFTLERYKFVAKMLDGADRVLEVGCGDGFGARVIAQSVGSVTAVDLDSDFIESAKSVASDRWAIDFRVHDMLDGPVDGDFSGVCSLDALEHIDPRNEDRFITNMIAPLAGDGVCIIGMPSLQSQAYASRFSKLGHVNCQDQPTTKALMLRYFTNVFMFSMNDEIVHTGHHAMSHYNIALCCGKRQA
jgi:cyclopropane fatty-acyl-phospholipid synthase-like methyltransferase